MSDPGTSVSTAIDPLQAHVDRHIRRALDACDGSPEKAARLLGMGRATIYRWLQGKRAGYKPNRASATVNALRSERLAVLNEVRNTWRSGSSNGKFTSWLDQRIKEEE